MNIYNDRILENSSKSHTCLFHYIYHCHMKSIAFSIIILNGIQCSNYWKNVRIIHTSRNIIKYMRAEIHWILKLFSKIWSIVLHTTHCLLQVGRTTVWDLVHEDVPQWKTGSKCLCGPFVKLVMFSTLHVIQSLQIISAHFAHQCQYRASNLNRCLNWSIKRDPIESGDLLMQL